MSAIAIRPDLAAPRFLGGGDYGLRLSDARFWAPYVEAVLRHHGLPADDLMAGFAGTYPTLLTGEVVVKLFGYFPGWAESYAAERTANALVAPCTGLAPAVHATGQLYDGPDSWPYLVFERLHGTAWRDAGLVDGERYAVAADVGHALRVVHSLDVSATGLLPDWLATEAAGAAARHRAWASLPPALIDEIDLYLSDWTARPARLVHADVTEDHVFITADGRLEGIIDWGDAMRTDPYYELGALHLGCFAGDRRLLRAFLDGFGWPIDEGFARHAMQVALMHRFDLVAGIREIVAGAASLGELADRLWTPGRRR